MKNKKNVGGYNQNTIWTRCIIVSVIVLILLTIGYWIFNICNTESGEYRSIGKSCFEKLTEVLTDNYSIDQN